MVDRFDKIAEFLAKNKKNYDKISDAIWDYAELAYAEKRSAEIQAAYMEKRGFRVTRNAGSVPNAVVAEYGSGKPIIGIFGELDALPANSQVADVPYQKPIEVGGSGHGCGHHLLGTASMAAVDALKEMLDTQSIKGTIRFYGCPAEEYGSGKAHMARAGLFNDLDIALGWHPMPYTALGNSGWIATIMIRYVFHGISANPAHSGHLGRSALDAAELMGVGTQYLREHVPADVRIHYAYQDAGGVAPNVIPSRVSVNYFVRATKIEDALEAKERVDKIAEGAALMTGTTVEGFLHNALANYCANPVIDDVLQKLLEEIPMPTYTAEELSYAQQFMDNTSEAQIRSWKNLLHDNLDLDGEALDGEAAKPISDIVLQPKKFPLMGSTDFGDVSQIVPAGHILATCFTAGSTCHSWQACAVGKSEVAHKGAMHAAKVLATAGLKFFESPELVAEAKQAFDKVMNGRVYQSIIPPEIGPHGYEY